MPDGSYLVRLNACLASPCGMPGYHECGPVVATVPRSQFIEAFEINTFGTYCGAEEATEHIDLDIFGTGVCFKTPLPHRRVNHCPLSSKLTT
jgi:hypothetical protein